MSLLPRGDEYNLAVQNPKIAFADIDLKYGDVETTLLGLPKPYSGGFTITYKLINSGKGWAVRCFHRDIKDLQKRYDLIGQFIDRNKLKYLIEAKFIPYGIKVNASDFPIIKMLWIEGDTLNTYIGKHYNNRSKIEKLLDDFLNLIIELDRYGIAHGDLQHGNIIVKDDNLFLIDYDGMFLPELSHLESNEIGHVNYQHPNRTLVNFDQKIDRFSALVIYIGLKAISISPSLWKKYDNGENILFKSQDFRDCNKSSLIKDLLNIEEIKPLVERFMGCCCLPYEKLPSFQDFMNGNFEFDINIPSGKVNQRIQYKVIAANHSQELLSNFGEKVEVVGLVGDFQQGSIFQNWSFYLLIFGPINSITFTVVIPNQIINVLITEGINVSSLIGKYVSITGVIESFNNKPQITLELPTQIQILSWSEALTKLNAARYLQGKRSNIYGMRENILEEFQKKIKQDIDYNVNYFPKVNRNNFPAENNKLSRQKTKKLKWYKPKKSKSYRDSDHTLYAGCISGWIGGLFYNFILVDSSMLQLSIIGGLVCMGIFAIIGIILFELIRS